MSAFTLNPHSTLNGTPVPPEDRKCPVLPEEFWESRPVFQHIRAAAWSGGNSGDAALAAVLAKAIYLTDYRIVLPKITGRWGSLNLLVGLAGPPGAGKGSTLDLVEELLPNEPPNGKKIAAGTGEGISRAFYAMLPDFDEKGELTKTTTLQRSGDALYIRINEGEVIKKLAGRQGSTILEVWRALYSGEELGFSNASQDRSFPVEPHTYRASLIMALQPEKADGLLNDVAGGTPQRFIWAALSDPNCPEGGGPAVPHPGALAWTPPDPSSLEAVEVFGKTLRVMGIDPDIASEIDAARRAVTRGEVVLGEMDAHRNLTKLKVSAIFALLDDRLAIGGEDWRLAEIFMKNSDGARCWLARTVAEDGAKRARANARRRGREQVQISSDLREAEVRAEAMARTIWKHLQAKHGDGSPCGARCHRDCTNSKLRPHLEPGRVRAMGHGWVEEDDAGNLILGPNQP